MSTLIDPRPLEPVDNNLADVINWTVKKIRWNPNACRRDVTYESNSGGSEKFLQSVLDIALSDDFQCDIFVDATEYEPKVLADGKIVPSKLEIPSAPTPVIDWQISPIVGVEEQGQDLFELFDWIEYAINERKDFKIEFSAHDPTP